MYVLLNKLSPKINHFLNNILDLQPRIEEATYFYKIKKTEKEISPLNPLNSGYGILVSIVMPVTSK